MSNTDGPDDFESKSAAFLTWLVQRGAWISSDIKLADLRQTNAGRGVGIVYPVCYSEQHEELHADQTFASTVAISPLPADTELFRIPKTAILTPATSSLPSTVLSSLSDPWLTLIPSMIYEYQLGAASAWHPYLDLLPSAFDTLMFWTPAELSALTGSAVLAKIGKTSADATFTAELLPRIRAHAETFAAQSLSDEQLLALCHRMGSIIMAYAFDLEDAGPLAARKNANQSASGGEGEDEEAADGWEVDGDAGGDDEGAALLPKGMVPLADLLNADADRNNAKLFYEDDAVVMKTICPVPAGAELLNDYGPLPRADVLRRYGYVTERYAAYDVVEVSLALIKARAQELPGASAETVNARTQYLEEQGVLDDAYDIAGPDSEDGQFSEELCALLNALTMSQDDFDKMRRKDKLPKPEPSDAARQLLYTVVVYRYAMYPGSHSTIEVDGDARRLHMARAVVDGEKKLLQEAVSVLTSSTSDGRKRRAETLDEEAEQIRNPSKK